MRWSTLLFAVALWSMSGAEADARAAGLDPGQDAGSHAQGEDARGVAWREAMERSELLDPMIDEERAFAARDAERGVYGAALVRYRSIAGVLREDIEQLDDAGVDRWGDANGQERRERRQRQLDEIRSIVRLLNFR